MRKTFLQRIMVAIVIGAVSGSVTGQDWPNLGGNAARNGLAPGVLGPRSANLLWSNTQDYSIISWHPYVHDGRVFVIREWGFPQQGGNANDALIAYDLTTGTEQWRVTLPFGGDTNLEWIAWIAAAGNGQVYASRASNDKPQPIRAYDTATGTSLWVSEFETDAFAYDGVILAPNGDLIVGDKTNIVRISVVDGATIWQTTRNCSVSGNCGGAAALGSAALYIDEVAPGGQIVTKLDLETGTRLYSSPVMPGFLSQTSPFLSPDGNRVYYARMQNNPSVDFLYAFEDTGTALVELWSTPIGYSEIQGVGPTGIIYARSTNDEIVGLSPETGQVLCSAGVLSPLGAWLMIAIDGAGKVYLSNRWASSPANQGRVWVFSPELQTLYFTLELDRQNQGGPVLAGRNLLIVADRVGVYAYRGSIDGDLDDDGDVDLADLAALLAAYGACIGDPGYLPAADINGDGCVGLSDLAALLGNYGFSG